MMSGLCHALTALYSGKEPWYLEKRLGRPHSSSECSVEENRLHICYKLDTYCLFIHPVV
jgi:hypothetical protein